MYSPRNHTQGRCDGQAHVYGTGTNSATQKSIPHPMLNKCKIMPKKLHKIYFLNSNSCWKWICCLIRRRSTSSWRSSRTPQERRVPGRFRISYMPHISFLIQSAGRNAGASLRRVIIASSSPAHLSQTRLLNVTKTDHAISTTITYPSTAITQPPSPACCCEPTQLSWKLSSILTL